MSLFRRSLLTKVAAAVMMITAAASARAQNYPTRPITAIVPFAGGSASDVVSRILFDSMSKSLGQPIVVENRPGAGGNSGTADAAKAAPDGYTIVGAGSGPIAANTTLYKHLDYDPLKDLVTISPFASFTIVVVASNKLPVNNLQELIAHAKAHPGELNYGSFGIGNLTHLMGELLQSAAGIRMTHVPYKGQTPSITDLLAGQIALAFTTTAGVTDLVETGKLDLLATFGEERDEQFPKTPTVVEFGYPSVVVVGWSGLLAPAGVPPHIIAKLHSGMVRALAMPDVKDAISRQGSKAVSSASSEEFARYIKAEAEKFRAVIKAAGLEGSQ